MLSGARGRREILNNGEIVSGKRLTVLHILNSGEIVSDRVLTVTVCKVTHDKSLQCLMKGEP